MQSLHVLPKHCLWRRYDRAAGTVGPVLNSFHPSIHPSSPRSLAPSLVVSARPTIVVVVAAVSSLEGPAENGMKPRLAGHEGWPGTWGRRRRRRQRCLRYTALAEKQPSHSRAWPNRTARGRRPALSLSLSLSLSFCRLVRWPSSFSSLLGLLPLGAVVPAFLSSLLLFLPFLPPICERGRGGLLRASEGGKEERKEGRKAR